MTEWNRQAKKPDAGADWRVGYNREGSSFCSQLTIGAEKMKVRHQMNSEPTR